VCTEGGQSRKNVRDLESHAVSVNIQVSEQDCGSIRGLLRYSCVRPEEGGSVRRLEKTAYKELHILYASLYIIRAIKSRRMRWTGHVVRMGEMGNV
jgi:hypothetical protein